MAILGVQRPQHRVQKVVRNRRTSGTKKEARNERAWKIGFSDKWSDNPSRNPGADLLEGG